MIAPYSNGCQPDRLAQLMKNRTSLDEEVDLASHIENCPRCQNALEQLAADVSDWEAVRESFSRNTVSSDQGIETKDICTDSDSIVGRFDGPGDLFEPSPDRTKLGLLGNIEIVSVIGKGGMGVVFKGFDTTLKRFVAVKVLSPDQAVSATARARFRREAESIAAVVNEHVVPIHSVHAEHNPPYIVMAFVPGCSLQEKLDAEGFLSVQELLRIGQQIAKGLVSAHSKGLVHRDIKPANVLLEDGLDRVKLTDFGLARSVDDVMLTRLGGVSGTPQFMSPEQAAGKKVDFRSDLFSLGITLYAMGTGCMPFSSEASFGVMNQICEHTPQSMQELNSDVPAWLDCLVFRLLEKSPDKRYQSAAEVADLLEKCLAYVQQPTLLKLPTGLKTRKRKFPIPFQHFMLGAGIGLLLVSALFALWATGILGPADPAGNNHDESNVAKKSTRDSQKSKQESNSEIYWLPGQVQPGKPQIFSFGQGILRGHIFTRTMQDGRLVVNVVGISSDERIQVGLTTIRLIDEQGIEVPLDGQITSSTELVSCKHISFVQRTTDPFTAPATIQLVIQKLTEEDKE